LGITDNGPNLKRIKQAIEKLGNTSCISKGAFYKKATREFIESGKAFHFLQEWGFKGELHEGNLLDSNFVSLHPWVRENLDAFYVKSLDWYLLRSLESEIAALLYPHLSCVFHSRRGDQEYIELGYSWLAQRLGIKVQLDLREAKKQLKAAHNELIGKGYLSKVDWLQDKIRYFPGIRASVEVARQKKRKRAVPPKTARQLIIPTLEKVKGIVDERANEIAYQATKLRMGRPLNLERLVMLNITPEEVHAALETSQDAPGTSN
jgi:hypothetical protein